MATEAKKATPQAAERTKKPWPRRLHGTVGLVAAVGAICFAASATFTEVRARAIDEQTERLKTDAEPSINRLVELGGAIQKERGAAQRALASSDPLAARDEIASLHAAAEAKLAEYLALPRDDGEVEVQEHLVAGMGRFEESLGALLAPPEEHAQVPQLATVETAADDLLARSRDALVLTVRESETASDAIAHARARANRDALITGSLALIFTLATGLIASLTIRRYMKLTEEHEKLLGERASDLERFGERLMHDLRNPLGAATLALNMMKKIREPGQPMLDDMIARAERNLAKALGIMESFFQFARAARELEPGAHANLAKTLETVVGDVSATPDAEGAEIAIEPFVDVAVACEEGVLSSIVENLLRNAVKYTKNSASRLITVRASKTTDTVHVEIEDRGPGIPEPLLDTVFQPYTRLDAKKEGGFGLGLAMVKRFCDARGGNVGVRSKGVGKGCTFWFELPVASAS